MLERPNIYAIFLKRWGFKDVKYDIPRCQSHSIRPSPFKWSPQCKKKTLYFIISGEISEKLGSQRLLAQAHFWCASNFLPVSTCPYICAKNALWKIAEPPIYTQNRKLIVVFSLTFQVERPVSRYERLKLTFMCERFSHCIYSFCSTELTKSRNTWSLKSRNTWRLTAVPQL